MSRKFQVSFLKRIYHFSVESKLFMYKLKWNIKLKIEQITCFYSTLFRKGQEFYDVNIDLKFKVRFQHEVSAKCVFLAMSFMFEAGIFC